TAIKHFRKADVAVMAGLGYTLDMGFDVDLRYYRSLSTTYDEQSGSSRLRLWTNLVEHIPFRNKDPSDLLALFPHGFSDVVVP
ncbi:MAG: hypothetical protein JST41_09135, partial [Bacteroidetes bacterium]|nr:hypothetical protein [Bacteroidota bacterium]